jgi:hypothetical protein
MRRCSLILVAGLALAPMALSLGCASATIALKEKLGYAKREQLVARVKDARDSQEQAKQQFDSALAEFLAVTKVDVGQLESQYKKIESAYNKSRDRASAVSSRIDDVKLVADKLFAEWNDEIKQINDPSDRAADQRMLADSQARYQRLLSVMQQAESRMGPVLESFNSKRLLLKHNLNARAIAAMQGTVDKVGNDVSELIREMEASIAEANRYIDQMNAGQ